MKKRTVLITALMIFILSLFWSGRGGFVLAQNGPDMDGPDGGADLEAGPSAGVSPKPAPTETVAEPSEDESLNFENADIYGVIKVIADALDINYVIDPMIKGRVNLHTKGRISKEELFNIFAAVLKNNGAAVIKDGELYHIVPIGSVKTRMLLPNVGTQPGRRVPGDSIVLQLIHLDFISATEVSQILKPLMSVGAEITPFDKNKVIIVTDFSDNIRKLIKIVDLIDVDIFEGATLKIYSIKNAGVQDLARDMQKIFAALEVPTKSGRGAGVNFIPISRINSLLVVSSIPRILIEVDKWIEELDRNISQDEIRTYVYHVKNGIAVELADVLNMIFEDSDIEKGSLRKDAGIIRTVKDAVRATTPEKALGKISIEQAKKITSEVSVIAYPTTNTIIIKSTPRDFSVVEDLLEELDIMPRQVMIEIMIAEVTLDESTSLGIEFAYFDDEVLIGTDFGLSNPGTLASGGLTASIVKSNYIATLNALASENRLNILAYPHVVASDGKKASIDIGDEVPLVSSRIFIDNREEVTIERRDTGVIVNVTPHINSSGLVTLDLTVELSAAADAVVEGESDIRIFQRNADTSMVIHDKETVIIGGLINSKNEYVVKKVPFLGDIPILGLLFRSSKDMLLRTELVILITPRVIRSREDSKEVTDEFMKKIRDLRETLEGEGEGEGEGEDI
ncbi:MAG: type II secretion system secretin GspD [Thermodesulfobacteriota bacterium]